MNGFSAVIVAAGKGERLGAPKQFLPLGGVPLLLWSVKAMASHPDVRQILVVLPGPVAEAPPRWLTDAPVRCCTGGETRRESAGAGVRAADADAALIVIHDAARPFISRAVIDRVLEAAVRTGAAVPVVPLVDTIKRTRAGRVVETVVRDGLGRAQTPQGFESALIRALHERAASEGVEASDDVALAEERGHPVEVVPGDPWNLKVTTAADLALAEWLIESGRVHPPTDGS